MAISRRFNVGRAQSDRADRVSLWRLGWAEWWALAKRVWFEIEQDEMLGRAAQLAYYFLLALFPALLFLTALVGLFPFSASIPELMQYMQTVLPADAFSLIQKYIESVMLGSGMDLLSLGILGALWASSSGVTAIMEALNVAYGAVETRPFWKVRLIGIILTGVLAGFVLLSTALILYGNDIVQWGAETLGFGWALAMMWDVFQWPVIAGPMLLAMSLIYYVCPDVEQEWRWVTPGAVFAVVSWIAVSLGFKLYVNNFGTYNVVYGSIGGVIVLLLWFYFTGLMILIGGEINSEIEAVCRRGRKRSQKVRLVRALT